MEHLRKYLSKIYVMLFVIIAIACSDSDDEPAAPAPPKILSVELRTSATHGEYLADSNGKALYYFTPDLDGSSSCSGGCLAAWPAFFMETIQVGNGLNAAGFNTITRADGTKQTTYKGWPLYYFAGDAKAGDVNGDNADESWYVAKTDYSVMVADNAEGAKLLVDPAGRTLYHFTSDTENVSNCKDGCIVTWPVFLDETITVPSFFSEADFGTITRADGAKQTTYKGNPLYYFAQDQVRGDIKGQGVGNKWFILTELQ